ncbi:hypothetical protein QYE76_029513 [Lolium multiflorum]|uniref:Uncharacterized protein n=1 Tax=Lolium multiflorum TaxID=4521 RepID=A0AAD8VID1_LOLMU|nr:hypothetical protein QYE76_029513 [Lolium multiflorum]
MKASQEQPPPPPLQAPLRYASAVMPPGLSKEEAMRLAMETSAVASPSWSPRPMPSPSYGMPPVSNRVPNAACASTVYTLDVALGTSAAWHATLMEEAMRLAMKASQEEPPPPPLQAPLRYASAVMEEAMRLAMETSAVASPSWSPRLMPSPSYGMPPASNRVPNAACASTVYTLDVALGTSDLHH